MYVDTYAYDSYQKYDMTGVRRGTPSVFLPPLLFIPPVILWWVGLHAARVVHLTTGNHRPAGR